MFLFKINVKIKIIIIVIAAITLLFLSSILLLLYSFIITASRLSMENNYFIFIKFIIYIVYT